MLTNRSTRASSELGTRARLALFHGTSLSAADALGMDDAEITYDCMMRNGVRANNLLAAAQGPAALRARGATTATQLRQLGLESLHLCDADLCNEACLAYGAAAVTDAFLVSAADAVNLAGMEAMHILDLQPKRLLECCVGFPGEARAVLEQLPHGASLHNVPCATVLDAGLRAEALRHVGYGLTGVCAQLHPTGPQLLKLGYQA